MAITRDERRAGFILFGIAATEGTWCLFNIVGGRAARFASYLGFVHGGAGMGGWIGAVLVAAIYVGYAARIPSVAANLFAPSWLKVLGLAVAVAAGICEESIFRKLLMDGLARRGDGVALQIALSGLAFGAAHGVWGAIRGSLAAAAGAIIATGILGAMLAGIYVAGHRVLAPCVVAHFLINALAEPGLVLAALRGELSPRRRAA